MNHSSIIHNPNSSELLILVEIYGSIYLHDKNRPCVTLKIGCFQKKGIDVCGKISHTIMKHGLHKGASTMPQS